MNVGHLQTFGLAGTVVAAYVVVVDDWPVVVGAAVVAAFEHFDESVRFVVVGFVDLNFVEIYFEIVVVVSLVDSLYAVDSSMGWKQVSETVMPVRQLTVDNEEGIDFELVVESGPAARVVFVLVGAAALAAAVFPFHLIVFAVGQAVAG